jgi:chemotaxis protein methyltransferase CheR
MNLSHSNSSYLKKFIYENAGIKLEQDKEYLLKNRLSPVLRKLNIDNFDDLCSKLSRKDKETIAEVVDALATNETYFFRDIKPFQFFKEDILPAIAKNNAGSKINILSSACSTGQESYSILISAFEKGYMNINVDGFDISGKAIKKAKESIYNQFEVQRGLPVQLLIKYFDKEEESYWQVKNLLKKKANFFKHNIFKPFEKQYDCIFCRNILIYFDQDKKRQALENVCKHLKTGGYLILGSSETSNILPDQLEQDKNMRAAYIKR